MRWYDMNAASTPYDLDGGCSPPRPGCRRLGGSRGGGGRTPYDRGSLMGIRSWFRSRRSGDAPEDGRSSLIKYRYEDPDFEPIEQAAAADVAAGGEGDRLGGRDSPASQGGRETP